MSDLPLEIADDEAVVRIITNKMLKSGGKIHRNAFQPRRGVSGGISVIRHDYMGSDFCKHHGKTKVQKLESPDSRIYKGLAAVRVMTFRSLGGNVHDTRDQFLGHADACVGMVRPGQPDPLDPEVQLAFDKRLDAILAKTRYFPDPDPAVDAWVGDPVQA